MFRTFLLIIYIYFVLSIANQQINAKKKGWGQVWTLIGNIPYGEQWNSSLGSSCWYSYWERNLAYSSYITTRLLTCTLIICPLSIGFPHRADGSGNDSEIGRQYNGESKRPNRYQCVLPKDVLLLTLFIELILSIN